MTAKRKLKRRVRERQVRTGERYTAARRRLLAERSEAAPGTVAVVEAAPGTVAVVEAAPGTVAVVEAASGTVAVVEAAPSTVPVVQLHDVSAEAVRLGFQCRISMFPALRERADAAIVLAGLRDALIGNPGDPASVQLFGAAFGISSTGDRPREPRRQLGLRALALQRLHTEIGRGADPGSMITFRVVGRDGLVPVLCMLWGRALVLTLGDGMMEVELSRIAIERAPVPRRADAEVTGAVRTVLESGRPQAHAVFAPGDLVRVTDGPFARFSATVEEVLADEGKLKVSVTISGGATSVLLDVTCVEQVARLFLIYEGRRYPVTKREFVIGRGRARCDLAIRDGMVSRKHAAVIHRNDTYYIKDLGATNGIHYKGMQIDNKRIDEGDVFHIGGHELRFTYRTGG